MKEQSEITQPLQKARNMKEKTELGRSRDTEENKKKMSKKLYIEEMIHRTVCVSVSYSS